jgi:hypothetical protein
MMNNVECHNSVISLIVILICLGACGCGQDPATELTGEGLTAKHMLTDLGLLLQDLAANNRPVPTNQTEMAAHDALWPSVSPGLVNNEIVYQWGGRIDPAGGETVLAYEKKAPSEGGWVLMQDGTVKQITADEFKAAPKAPTAAKAKR